MSALGVDRDYSEYMMGYIISTYHGIKIKGIEFLRGIYIASGLSIKPKTRISKIEALKEIIRAWGLNPEEILTKETLTKPHRTVIDRSQIEQSQIHQLTVPLKQQMLKEIQGNQNQKSINSSLSGGSLRDSNLVKRKNASAFPRAAPVEDEGLMSLFRDPLQIYNGYPRAR